MHPQQNTVVNAGRNKLRTGHQAIHQTNNFLTNNGHGWIEVSFVITLGGHVYKIFNDLGPDFLFVSLNKLINISLYDKLKQKCNLIGSYAWSITGQMQRWRHHWQNVAFFITKTNRLHIDVRLNNKRYQKTSKFRKNISDRLGCKWCATSLF